MPGPRNVIQKPKNFEKTFKRFMKELGTYKVQIIVTVIFTAISVLLTLFGPMVLGMMTTSATSSIAAGKGILWDEIIGLVILLISLYVISGIISYVQELILTRISARFSNKMRSKILDKISRLPMSYFDHAKIGDVMSRMTNDVDTAVGNLAQTINEIVISVVTLVGITAMMLIISVPLSLVAIIAIPVSTIFVKRIAEKAQKHFKRQRKYLGN